MASVNKVFLLGNLTRDPEIRELPSGTTVCDFGMATNRQYKTSAGEEREETLFVDCAAFGRVGEVIGEYCKKGRQLFVEGRLHYETWEDKATNAKRSKLSVIVESFQFIGPRDGEGGQAAGHDAFAGAGGSGGGKPWKRAQGAAGGQGQHAGPHGQAHGESRGEHRGENRGENRTEPRKGGAPMGKPAKKVGKSVDQLAEEKDHFEDAELPF